CFYTLLYMFSLLPHPTSPLFPYTTLFRSADPGRSELAHQGRGDRQLGTQAQPDHEAQCDQHRESGGQGGGTGLAMLIALRFVVRSEEHTSELQSRFDLVCRLLLEKKKI